MKLSCLEGICSELCGQLIQPQVEPEASRDVLSRGPGQGAGSPLEGVHSGCASPLEGVWSGLKSPLEGAWSGRSVSAREDMPPWCVPRTSVGSSGCSLLSPAMLSRIQPFQDLLCWIVLQYESFSQLILISSL